MKIPEALYTGDPTNLAFVKFQAQNTKFAEAIANLKCE